MVRSYTDTHRNTNRDTQSQELTSRFSHTEKPKEIHSESRAYILILRDTQIYTLRETRSHRHTLAQTQTRTNKHTNRPTDRNTN